MRGAHTQQSSMLCLMSPESRVPQAHPLRSIKALADTVLTELSPVFDAMYASTGRPSVPPERLLKSMLLMALYTVRSERQFVITSYSIHYTKLYDLVVQRHDERREAR